LKSTRAHGINGGFAAEPAAGIGKEIALRCFGFGYIIAQLDVDGVAVDGDQG
jgi:hypothetical protein